MSQQSTSDGRISNSRIKNVHMLYLPGKGKVITINSE